MLDWGLSFLKIRVVHGIAESYIYDYISSFFRMCGISVYDYILKEDAAFYGVTIASAVHEMTTVAVKNQENSKYIEQECAKEKTVQILLNGTSFNVKEQIFTALECICDRFFYNETDELKALLKIYSDKAMFDAFYCDQYAYVSDKHLEDVLGIYVQSYIEISNKEDRGMRFRYASVYLKYMIVCVCNQIGYRNPFEINKAIDECIILAETDKNNLIAEAAYLLCGRFCELDENQNMLAYEYYLRSLICSAENVMQKKFLENFRLTQKGKFTVESRDILFDAYINNIYEAIIPTNYLALYGMGNSYLKYNSAESAALECYRFCIQSNPNYYKAIYKKALCKYMENNGMEFLHCFNQVYEMTNFALERGEAQPRDLAYMLKAAHNLEKLSGDYKGLFVETLQRVRASQKYQLDKAVKLFSCLELKSEDLLSNLEVIVTQNLD